MYKLISIITLICSISAVSCQSTKDSRLTDYTETEAPENNYVINGKYTQLSIDKLGNIYLLNEKNEIFKYDQNYKLLFKNSFNTKGEISHVDVSNPQKLLVYFSDFQYILFLDNTLSEIKNLNLEELSYWDIQAVGQSVDNQIWIYDPVNHKLIKINDLGVTQLSSNELFSDVIEGSTPPRIIARGNNVYLYTDQEIMVFNIFGELLKTHMIYNIGIQFLESHLIYNTGTELKARKTKLVTMVDSDPSIIEANKDILDFYLDKSYQVFTLYNNGLSVTSLKEFFR